MIIKLRVRSYLQERIDRCQLLLVYRIWYSGRDQYSRLYLTKLSVRINDLSHDWNSKWYITTAKDLRLSPNENNPEWETICIW